MIRKAAEADRASLAKLAAKLWRNHSEEDGQPVGLAQCQLRHDYVEGTDSSPAGYPEGIFTEEAVRGKGIAAALLVRCESWAKEKSCTEFASDCELLNKASIRFHKALDFSEANRIVCFRKE